MSVLIKGIDIAQFRTILAYARTGANDVSLGNEITEVCEVPTPHGDLIDRRCFDVVGYSTVDDSFDRGVEFMLDKIDTAPTVIEEEE